ncbi:hypothetical protein BOO69_14365 [Sulfitobacter alexandrii]|uniref:Curlin associated repeat-containing protein n=1 Tax=Sulfitobacter alexandrii TaxID=1917485 RepID=A0A1J0WJW8_9RHOB|nr:hypothetical protein [Sulfitobacter alexandrii]APE44464.1 hypothetical protein BOO69_14365 [Sulfitobacter alexandrii]
MTFRKFALATTALTMIGAGAWADDNTVRIDQLGAGNVADIDQSEASFSYAGRDDYTTQRLDTLTMQQVGDDNMLSITQFGDRNYVGALSRNNGGDGSGVKQRGDKNEATITQDGVRNLVNSLTQDSDAGATAAQNTLTIEQTGVSRSHPLKNNGGLEDGADNYITGIAQINNGGATSAANDMQVTQTRDTAMKQFRANAIGRGGVGGNFGNDASHANVALKQEGAGNEMIVSQSGEENVIYDTRNSDVELLQLGNGNEMNVSQSGKENRIYTVSQNSTAGTTGNTANVSQSGERNGAAGLNKTFAGGVGATRSSVLQTGGGNVVNYSATGNDNQFGFTQIGNSNTVNQVTIVGNGNETAAYQQGDFNSASIAPIVGDGNDVGISQTGGNFNAATVQLTNGSDDNSIGISQTGNINGATVTADGDRNYVEVVQIGSNPSGVLMNIIGNDNGGGTFMGMATSGLGLASGLIKQDGFDNVFEGQIIGSDNQFAALQQGNDNEIQADVFGDGNEYAVSQIGNGNLSFIMQNGSGNVAGVSQ